jgi:predicted lysophospholipase L1 biosynthesis ABC-type transport system permease subunit
VTRRRWLAAAGVAAASIVVGTATTVGYGLATGFDRAARDADLPDVVARFDRERASTLDARVRALPNLQAASYRTEVTGVDLVDDRGHFLHRGVVHVVLGGRRGYAITAGHDLSPRPGEVVVERGLAREWGLRPGDPLTPSGLGDLHVAGIALSPDNVAYPLARAARVYVGEQEVRDAFHFRGELRPDLALLWLNDPSRADITLTQARAVSFGLGSLSFVTREGVQVLLSQAAGIIISLLVAFSLVALLAAGVMLAAGAHADVQRRLGAIGVQRAIGFTPGRIAGRQAGEAALVAAPAAAFGLAIGALAVAGPAGALLDALNEQGPGAALLLPLALCLLAVVAVVTAAATWPAWRAAKRPPAVIMRGGDMARGGGAGASTGLLGLGARFALAARGRWAAAVATIAVCAGVVTLMLALASLLERLRDDPGTVGKRYQLTARVDPSRLPQVRRLPGVAAAAPRYQVDGSDSFRLGEPVRLVAYPGDHTRFEAPPLASGRRLRSDSEAEVGLGLADALGLRRGSTLAVQTSDGEVRFRVSGVVRALDNQGRIAYVRPRRLLAADPGLTPDLAIRLTASADRAQVGAGLRRLGAPPARVGGATTRNGRFLGILAAVLRGVGLAVGLVCLYALAQALATTARERRGAVALLRATGADRLTVALVLGGAALAVAVPAALAGVILERVAFGPLVSRLAAGFAELALAPTAGQIALVIGGLLVLAALATTLVARRAMTEPIARGLREE